MLVSLPALRRKSLQRQACYVSKMPGLNYAFAKAAIRQLWKVGARILAGTAAPIDAWNSACRRIQCIPGSPWRVFNIPTWYQQHERLPRDPHLHLRQWELRS